MRYILAAILMVFGGYLHADTNSSSLLATVQFSGDGSGKFQVGTSLSFGCKIKNLGVQKSPAGQLEIRFQYPASLRDQPNSLLFKTETIEIPSIAAGEQLIVQFKGTQTLPNLFDYIRNDWGMREYQAILTVDQKEYIIGTASLTFSAYYYEAPARKTATSVPYIKQD